MIKYSQNMETSYPVMESFYTIQGEGYWSGTAAYFIRLGGCDVGCHWCDVKDSWNAGAHPQKSVAQLLDEVNNAKSNRVVITGGEPLLHNLQPLVDEFRSKQLLLHIETSGAHPVSGIWDWFCLSPKKFKLPLRENYQYADELKIIIYNRHDFEFAESQAVLCPPKTKLFLQPEWSKSHQILKEVVEFVKENPKWQISLQTHKYMEIP